MPFSSILPILRLATYSAGLDMRAGFRRTGLGLFWSSLGLVVVTAAFGVFFGVIFRQQLPPLEEFIPFLAAGMIAWAFIAGALHHSAGLVWNYLDIRRHSSLPLAAAVLRHLLHQGAVLGVNILLAFLIAGGLGYLPPVDPLGLLAGLVLLTANLIWISFGVALLAARFRDLPQLLAWSLHIAFFLSPILWPVYLLGRYEWLATINPITHLVALLRLPLLGKSLPVETWGGAIALLALGLPLILYLYRRFTPRLPYWS